MLWKLSLENTVFSFSLIVAIIAVIVVELYVQIVQGIIALCLVINGRKGRVNNVLELTMPIPGTYALVKFGIHLQLPLVFENSQIAIRKALLFCHSSVFIFTFNTFKFAIETFPANIYLFKVSNRNSWKRCEICSKLTIKIPERQKSVVDFVVGKLLVGLWILPSDIFSCFRRDSQLEGMCLYWFFIVFFVAFILLMDLVNQRSWRINGKCFRRYCSLYAVLRIIYHERNFHFCAVSANAFLQM